MQQQARYVPIMWGGSEASAKAPLSIFGDHNWTNVAITSDVALLAPPVVDPWRWAGSRARLFLVK